MKHVIVTPARNEAAHIGQVLASVTAQTCLPQLWIIVNDGSTDNTAELVAEYASKFDWIRLINLQTQGEERMGGSKVVNAFNRGYEFVKDRDFDFITKLDADLSLPADYFEKISKAFEAEPRLGICGGYIINVYPDGSKIVEKSADYHVRGALKSVRTTCWRDINGFRSHWYWDGLDIMEARFRSWDTRSLDLPVLHLRPTSSAYNPLKHAYRTGYESYRLGAGVFLTFVRAATRLRNKPILLGTFNFLKGYFAAALKREKLSIPADLSVFMNKFHYRRLYNSIGLKKK